MKVAKYAIVLAVGLALAGCEGTGAKQGGGTVVGAGLGALAGSQIGSGTGQLAAVAIGTLAGAFLGSEVGKSLDRADQAAMAQTTGYALESGRTGQVSTWQNPDSGHMGTVTPTRTYTASSGMPCREFTQTVNIGGRNETAYGRACRQADGSWQIVN